MDKNRKPTEELVLGTYVGKLSNNKIMVLLPDYYIFVGEEYEIAPVEEQE